MSLVDARMKHLEAKKQLLNAVNPSAHKQEQKKEQIFSAIVKIYLENESIKHKGYRWEALRLNKIIREFPELANKPVNKIHQADLINFRN